MKNEPINGGIKKLKDDLAKMTFKEKVDHIWTYYKHSLVILAVISILFSIFITSWKARNTNTLIAGIAINVHLSDEGTSIVKDEYFALVTTGGRERVIYTETDQDSFASTASLQSNYASLMNLTTLASAQELDYLLLDDTSLANLLSQGILLDMREFFNEEDFDKLGDKIIWLEATAKEGTSTLIPVAVNINELPFIQNYAQNKTNTFFAVVSNTPRQEACQQFWEYLNNWMPTES